MASDHEMELESYLEPEAAGVLCIHDVAETRKSDQGCVHIKPAS